MKRKRRQIQKSNSTYCNGFLENNNLVKLDEEFYQDLVIRTGIKPLNNSTRPTVCIMYKKSS